MSEIIDSTYEIIGKLGMGGGGVVYLANHLRLGKRVVLKADKRNIRTRETLLRREVDVLKELRHTYIPQVYDYFIEDGVSYTVMDYVDGESLDKLQKREKTFSQPQVICWAKQLLEALSYLHSPTHGDPPRGYVHSDIKPANIMLRPNGDICLIDFNISLAMGIENIVGKSEGYSSPEYYGLDYSFSSKNSSSYRTDPVDADKTMLLNDDKTELITTDESKSISQSSSVKKVFVPDARSDIYSVGATLYHLLSGKKPNKDALSVEPLSYKEFSPPLADIISKAMNPNPDLRFASADEMLKAFNDLWKNDPRVRRKKKQLAVVIPVLSVILATGVTAVFTGMKQMERFQSAQILASNSSEALSRGDVSAAVSYALDALVDDPRIFDIPYTPEAQLALTNALGVYDLSDSFKPHAIIELPSEPFRILKSPDETKLLACYAYELAIYDIESGELIITLPTLDSAYCGAKFISDAAILYAGKDGLTAYDISSDTVIWQGEFATAISVSEDNSTVAAIYRSDDIIKFYDIESGELISLRNLDGRKLNVPENDRFADSDRNVFELNEDGSLCAVSLSNGYLGIMDIYDEQRDMIVYNVSDNSYFDGNFVDNIFAFSSAGASGSLFGLIDCNTAQYLGGMDGNSIFTVKTYNDKLYVSLNDTVVMMNTETFEQTEVAYTENKNIDSFDISEKYAIATADNSYSIFFGGAGLLQSDTRQVNPDFALITDKYALLADRNSPVIEVLKLKDYSDSCIINYDPNIKHSEARVISDRSSIMLFDFNGFTVVNADGSIRTAVDLPETETVYDQQYRHDGDYLEVTYYNGSVVCYSAYTGEVISENEIAPPNESLDEELETESFIVRSPLHGTPTAYDKETGNKIADLNSEDYLTYITETDKYIIAQYISADGMYYGVLMNKAFEPIAQMPYLCDIAGDMLIYDLPAGNIKTSPIYELDELKEKARNYRNYAEML